MSGSKSNKRVEGNSAKGAGRAPATRAAAMAARPYGAVAGSPGRTSPFGQIDQAGTKLGDWRGITLARIRALIEQADPEVVEDVKWRKPSNSMAGVPVWSRGGIICTGETYKDKVKLTFPKGAALEDPAGLFNASLDGNTRRAIDLHEGDGIDEGAFKTLIRAAVALSMA